MLVMFSSDKKMSAGPWLIVHIFDAKSLFLTRKKMNRKFSG